MSGVTFDTAAFEADMKALLTDIDDRGYTAFVRSVKEAEESTNEHGYQNRTGKLQASRGYRAYRQGRLGWAGEIKWRAPYAQWVDSPTKAHAIAAKKAKMLRWYSYGQPVFRRRVWHPGTSGAGFSKHAAEQFELRATSTIQEGVDSAVAGHP